MLIKTELKDWTVYSHIKQGLFWRCCALMGKPRKDYLIKAKQFQGTQIAIILVTKPLTNFEKLNDHF